MRKKTRNSTNTFALSRELIWEATLSLLSLLLLLLLRRLIHTFEHCCDRNCCFGNIWLISFHCHSIYTHRSFTMLKVSAQCMWVENTCAHTQTYYTIHTYKCSEPHSYMPTGTRVLECFFLCVYRISTSTHTLGARTVYLQSRSIGVLRCLCLVCFCSLSIIATIARASKFLRCFTTALTHTHSYTLTQTLTRTYMFFCVCLHWNATAARKQRWWLNHRLSQHLDVSFKLIVS